MRLCGIKGKGETGVALLLLLHLGHHHPYLVGKPKKEQRVIRRPKGNRCSGSGSRFRSGFRSGTGVVLGVLLRGVVLTALTALTCVDLR